MYRKKTLFPIISILFIIIFSLLFSVYMQEKEFSYLIKLVLLISFFIFFFLFKNFNTSNVLICFILLYIKPREITLYGAILFLICVFIVELQLSNRSKIKIPFFYPFLILFCTSILSLIKAYDFVEGISMFLVVFLVPLLFVIIIKNSNFQFNDLLILLRTIVIVAAFVGIVGVIMALINPTLRLGSLWITAMTINGFYLMAFFISLGLIMHNKTQQSRLFYIFISIFILLGMIFTYTRMSLLALGFGLFLLFIKIKKIRKYALYLVIFVPLIIPSSFHQRLSIGVMEDPSIIIRFVAWYNSIDLIKNNFFFGIGFNTWSHIYKKMIPMTWLYAEHPHNIYIRYILELGVFGFTAFFYIIIKTVFEFLRVINKNDYLLFSLAISILVLLFACLTDVFISRYPIAFIFWLILAIMIRIINDKKNFFLTTERV